MTVLARLKLAAPIVAGLLVGCAPPATVKSLRPPNLALFADFGTRDLRHLYRTSVCGQLPKGSSDCDDVLLRFPDERSAAIAAVPRNLQNLYRIAFVPGLFNDCFHEAFHPFTDVVADLAASGFSVSDFRTAGRATSIENAQRLSRQFGESTTNARPFIVVVHSKGLPDVLELLLQYPPMSQSIAAIISVAGVVNGSPVADELYEFYRDWIATLPLPGCERGSGEEVTELRREVRLDWWRRNGSAIHVPIFSLAAVPTTGRVSVPLQEIHGKLATIDPLNDGQIVWYDAVAAQGYLLGFANADHLGIAIPPSQQIPALSFLFEDNVPRTALIRGAIEIVAATLDGAGRDSNAPHPVATVAQSED